VVAVFNRYFNLGELELVVNRFKAGQAVEVGEMTPSSEYVALANQIEGLMPAIEKAGGGGTPAETASAVEFLLEGLHLNKRLNKDRVGGKTQYRG
jgi:magnesium chelatase subunit I